MISRVTAYALLARRALAVQGLVYGRDYEMKAVGNRGGCARSCSMSHARWRRSQPPFSAEALMHGMKSLGRSDMWSSSRRRLRDAELGATRTGAVAFIRSYGGITALDKLARRHRDAREADVGAQARSVALNLPPRRPCSCAIPHSGSAGMRGRVRREWRTCSPFAPKRKGRGAQILLSARSSTSFLLRSDARVGAGTWKRRER